MQLTTESFFKRLGFWLAVAELGGDAPTHTAGMLRLLAADYVAWTAAAENLEPEQALDRVQDDRLFTRLIEASAI